MKARSFLVPQGGNGIDLVTESVTSDVNFLPVSRVCHHIHCDHVLVAILCMSSYSRFSLRQTFEFQSCDDFVETMSALPSCFYIAVIFLVLSTEAVKLSKLDAGSLVKRSHLMNAQIVTAQMALSAAMIFGIPAVSFGKITLKCKRS